MDFVPIDVKVQDSNTVTNTFYTEEQIKEMGAPKEKIPLFHIDLMLDEETSRPKFSTSAREVVGSICMIFEQGIKSL